MAASYFSNSSQYNIEFTPNLSTFLAHLFNRWYRWPHSNYWIWL